VIVVLLLYARSILGVIAGIVTAPFYGITSYIQHSSATIPTFIRDRGALLEEKRALEAKLSGQQGMELTLAQVLKENEELRLLLGATREERIAAGVVARPPYTPYDTLILDQGSDEGVIDHAPVFLGSGLAVGYVRSTTKGSSLVTLFSSPGVETSVYIFGPDIFARAYGVGGGVVRIDIPQGIALAQGDLVILPSLDSGVLGTIDSVQAIPTAPEQHAFVTLAAPIATMRLVSIGTHPVEPIDFAKAEESVAAATQDLFVFPIPEIIPSASITPTTTDGTATSTAL
jgi:cell shape-determining protein MreC